MNVGQQKKYFHEHKRSPLCEHLSNMVKYNMKTAILATNSKSLVNQGRYRIRL